MMITARLAALALLALTPAAQPGSAQTRGQLQAAPAGRPFFSTSAGYLTVRSADGAPLVEIEVPSGLEAPTILSTGEAWVLTATFLSRGRRELLILRNGPDGGTIRIEPPPQAEGSLRSGPVPLMRNDKLSGLAWLEGDHRRQLSVKAATLQEGKWEAVQTVAPPAEGTQIGLSGAILDEGTWLLAWSAFDGSDDDILISVRRGETWSPPERAHPDNQVPDITPAVVAYRDGARLAWSQFDGNDYRLVLATVRAARVTDVRTIGEPGSVLPSFPAEGAGEQILYRSFRPYGWTLLQIDATVRPWRRAQFPDSIFGDRALPEVSTDAGQVTLFWPEREKRLQRPWEPVL